MLESSQLNAEPYSHRQETVAVGCASSFEGKGYIYRKLTVQEIAIQSSESILDALKKGPKRL